MKIYAFVVILTSLSAFQIANATETNTPPVRVEFRFDGSLVVGEFEQFVKVHGTNTAYGRLSKELIIRTKNYEANVPVAKDVFILLMKGADDRYYLYAVQNSFRPAFAEQTFFHYFGEGSDAWLTDTDGMDFRMYFLPNGKVSAANVTKGYLLVRTSRGIVYCVPGPNDEGGEAYFYNDGVLQFCREKTSPNPSVRRRRH